MFERQFLQNLFYVTISFSNFGPFQDLSGMSSRLLSSNTLVEGMKAVEYPDPNPNAARKRELEEQIKAGCFSALFV